MKTYYLRCCSVRQCRIINLVVTHYVSYDSESMATALSALAVDLQLHNRYKQKGFIVKY